MTSADLKGGDRNSSPVMFTREFDRFFRTHEKVMWQFSAIDFNKLQPELLTPVDVAAVRGAMLVESHNPVYTMKILEYYRDDHEMTSFTITWGYEEMKHYAILRTYLEASGLVNPTELAAQLDVTRAGEWGDVETRFPRIQSFTYAMIQEWFTARFYKQFAQVTKEPLLQEILSLISKDEYRHCQYYLDKGRQELDLGRGTLKQVDEVLLNFDMPGPTFIPDYKENVFEPGMKVAPVDFSAIGEIADKVGQLTGRMHVFKLAADPAFQRKFLDELGLDITPLRLLSRRV